IDETGDALVVGEVQRLSHALAVAVPFGDPLRAIAERSGGENEALAGGPRRKGLLPVVSPRILPHARNHRNDHWRAHEALRLILEPEGAGIVLLCAADLREHFAEYLPGFALKQDEAPRH